MIWVKSSPNPRTHELYHRSFFDGLQSPANWRLARHLFTQIFFHPPLSSVPLSVVIAAAENFERDKLTT
jgi:hypothetical protein